MATFLAFGELLMRIATPRSKPGFEPKDLTSSFCGAEANIAAGLAGLGHKAGLASVVPDNPIGAAAKNSLRAVGVDAGSIMAIPGRMGLLFLEPGASARASRITYDRAGSAFANCDWQSVDWRALLTDKDWLITSGITAALGAGPLSALKEAMTTARSMGVKVAFDCNFRPTLWTGREAQAPEILRELSLAADLLLAGRRAIGMITGCTFEDGDANAQFAAAAHHVFTLSPHTHHVAATRRHILSSDRHRMTGLVASRNGLGITDTVEIDAIVDRVGTGDAFAAGVLHGLSSGFSLDDTAGFALACSRWAHSVEGDFMRATFEDIEHLRGSQGDVRR